MIDHILGGEFLLTTSSKGSTPYVNTSNPITGMVAYDASSQTMKVYDGISWQTIGAGTATVNLTPNAISILKWAELKMQEEKELLALCNEHPAIMSLVDEMNLVVADYKHKITMVKNLIKKEETIGTK